MLLTSKWAQSVDCDLQLCQRNDSRAAGGSIRGSIANRTSHLVACPQNVFPPARRARSRSQTIGIRHAQSPAQRPQYPDREKMLSGQWGQHNRALEHGQANVMTPRLPTRTPFRGNGYAPARLCIRLLADALQTVRCCCRSSGYRNFANATRSIAMQHRL